MVNGQLSISAAWIFVQTLNIYSYIEVKKTKKRKEKRSSFAIDSAESFFETAY